MKFGKELKIKSIPAWREQYMSYKPLKRVITRLAMQMKEQRDREEKAEFDSAANGDSDAQPPPTTERVPLLRRESSTTGAQVQRRLSRVYGTTTELNGGGGGGGGAAADVSEAEQREMITGDAKKEFRAIIDNDIDKVNLHYKGKLADCKAAFQRIYDTVRDSGAEERRERGARGGGEEGSASAIIEVPADGVSKEGNGTAVSQSSTSAPAASSSSPSPPTGIPDLDRPLSHIRSTSPLSMPPLTPLPSTQPRPSISVSLSKQLEVQSAKLLSLYRESCQLASFSELNHAGLRKIMKKLDKQTGEEGHQEEMIQRLQGEPFMETEELKDLLAREEELYHRLMLAKGEDVRESGARLRAIKKEVDEPSEEEDHDHTAVKYRYLMLAFFAYFLVLSIPLLPPSQERAQRCAALLSLITILWVTEAIPFFVSSLLIPFFVIITGILADEQGNTLSAEKASKVAFGAMFNDTIMLILGGFSISTAFSQCGFELRLAAILQRQLGHRPILFLLAFMGLGAFLSMWISNVAAPVLLTSLLLPIVHDFGSGSNDARTYAKALLLGLAFACNIGGMMSPISSPQNAVALGFLEQQDPEHVISFVQWLYISIPYCTLGLLGAWLWLWKVYIGEGVEIPSIPAIVYEKRPLTRTDYSVIGVSLLTILLWCSLSYTRPFLGEMGTVAVIPMVTFFGTGFLSKTDLCKKFKWDLILLVGGGSVLGSAVNSSRLLQLISEWIKPHLVGQPLVLTVFAVLFLVFLITTFVSHTVAALILTPLIIRIGASAGHTQLVVMAATLMMSGTMSLPTSSFPNINSLSQEDDFGRPFLHSVDFLRHGTAVALALWALLNVVAVTYMQLVFAPDVVRPEGAGLTGGGGGGGGEVMGGE